MKQFRIKQYSHNSLYCIQQRTGIFTWKTLDAVPNRQHALNIINKLIINGYQTEDFKLIELCSNEIFIFLPTIGYHKKSLLFAWFKVGININF